MKNNLLTGNIVVIFIKYIVASITGMLFVSLYILFDTIFVGNGVGNEGLAALNISIPIYNVLFGTGILVGTGSATIMSISIGRNNIERAQKAFEHSIFLGIISGVTFTLIGLLCMDSIVIFLGGTPETEPLISSYLGKIIPFSWSFIMVYNLGIVIRADNGSKRVMVAMSIGGLTNIILDYLLIFPLKMGMQGAAIATTISSLVSLTILIWHFVGKHSSYKIKVFKLDRFITKSIISIGMASFIIEISSGIIIFQFNKELLTIIGDIGVSAYSIIANVSLMVVAVFTGISQGIHPIVSVNYGGGNFYRIKKVLKYSIICAGIIGSFFMILGLLMPEAIISVFTNETGEIISITKVGIQIYFLSFPVSGINIVMSGFFQSISQSKYSTLISLLRGIVFTTLILRILVNVFEVKGIWLTTPIVECLTFIVILGIFFVKRKNLQCKNCC